MKNHLTKFEQFAKGKTNKSNASNNRAFIYTRVSTKEQAENNQSLDTQKRICEEYAIKNNLDIVGYFGGTYESAKSDERTEFQRMMKAAKTAKISKIIIFSYDRFSRSGANSIIITEELAKLGITLQSATQNIDVSTYSGVFQQDLMFLFNKLENDTRRGKCMVGMKEKLKNGGWIGQVPKGYTYTHHRGEDQKIVINEEGKLLKKAFHWKAEQNMPHPLIIKKLAKAGLNIPIQLLTDTFRNPFYCGLIANKMLKGAIVKGNHPALITEEMFLKINQKLAPNGYKSNRYNEMLPLKQFVKCSVCGNTMTGYLVKRKGLHYYKCHKAGCHCNKSAKFMHQKFEDLLSNLCFKEVLIEPIKIQVGYTFENLTQDQRESERILKTKLNELKLKVEEMEEKHAVGEINKAIFEKFSEKYYAQIAEINVEIGKTHTKTSNPQKLIEFAVKISSNLKAIWANANHTQRLNFQKMVFPEGILFDKEKGQHLTKRINWVFSTIARISSSFEEKENGIFDFFIEKSRSVARSGVEPETSGL